VTFCIWIDANACPNPIKNVLFRAAQKRQLPTVLVANQTIGVPPSKYIRSIRVSGGFDVADNYIVQHLQAGDLVITGDIPLAALVLERGGFALSPRGNSFNRENIGEKLAMRDFMAEMRDAGMQTGGPAAMTAKDVQNFANALDRFLASRLR
jgi:uncharacterized protein YaiI (UPF0178 family)